MLSLWFVLSVFCKDLHCKIYLNTSVSITLLNAFCLQNGEDDECSNDDDDNNEAEEAEEQANWV